MNPQRALQEQIERYRRMTGEKRLGTALELHALSCNIAREGIRKQNPNADAAEVAAGATGTPLCATRTFLNWRQSGKNNA